MQDVSNDPFLTHSKAQPRTRGVTLKTRGVGGDAFETHKDKGKDLRRDLGIKLGICDFIMMMLLPWLLYVLAFCSFGFLQHSWGQAVWLVAVFAGIFSATTLGVAISMRHGAFFVLGLCCLLCTLAGVFFGKFAWGTYTRQVYWMQSGRAYTNVTGATQAFSVTDAATLQFWNATEKAPSAIVDGTKAVGFVDDNLYCVAPILSKSQINAPVTWVQFWAVGINCCTKRGSFTCDSALEYAAANGIAPPKNSTPVPGGTREIFEMAVREAEGAHNVQSAPGAMMIRWVADPQTLKDDMWTSSIWLCAISSFSVLLVTSVLACAARLVGVGSLDKRERDPGSTRYATAADYRSVRDTRADYRTQVP